MKVIGKAMTQSNNLTMDLSNRTHELMLRYGKPVLLGTLRDQAEAEDCANNLLTTMCVMNTFLAQGKLVKVWLDRGVLKLLAI